MPGTPCLQQADNKGAASNLFTDGHLKIKFNVNDEIDTPPTPSTYKSLIQRM